MTTIAGCARALLTGGLGTVLAQSPCAFALVPGDAIGGVDGECRCVAPWDPDGPGPMSQHVVFAGAFRVAGSVVSPNIAAYEPGARTWHALGAGLSGPVTAVLALPNGHLVAAGTPGLVSEWDGSSWHALGGMFSQALGALALLPNGDIVAGGVFQTIGGATINGIARWDGTAWNAMGAPTLPFMPGVVYALAVSTSGDLVAGGWFDHMGGVACSNIARWDGTAWYPLGGGSPATVLAMTATTNGDVVASGSFATSAGTATIARWNGTAWLPLAAGLPTSAGVLAPLPNGGVLVIGAGGIQAASSAIAVPYAPWSPGAPAIDAAFVAANGELFVGGLFTTTSTVEARNVARWDGTAWAATAAGNHAPIRAVAARPDGSFVVAGDFATIGGLPANRLARFDGTWLPIASTASGTMRAIVARPDGEVVIAGDFAGPGSTDGAARWNGGAATPIAPGTWGTRVVRTLAIASNGDALLGWTDMSSFQCGVARWDGANLTSTTLGTGVVDALVELPNGALVLSGVFSAGGPFTSLVVWDGVQMVPFPVLLNGGVASLAVASNGDLIAGGAFSTPNRIARWNGTAWQSLGATFTGSVLSIAALPDGDLVVCERTSNSAGFQSRVHQWNGASWSLLADLRGDARSAWAPWGTLAIGGDFVEANGSASAYFARLVPSCAAAVTDLGGGCVGSAGPVTLRALEWPWIGGELRTEAGGLPAGAMSIGVFGFQAVLHPLPQLHPLGVAGCDLLVSDDILLQFGVAGGSAQPRLPVPASPPLIGASFRHQLLGVEIAPAGHVTGITSSNALQLTIGAL